MTTILDLITDATPTADDAIYMVNDPGGTPGDRLVTVGNLATALSSLLGVSFVATTGAQNVGGVKTFTSTPIIPDEAYGVGWNGKLEPATKNAIYDWSVALPTLGTTTPGSINVYTSSGVTYVDFLGSTSGVFSDVTFTIQDNLDATKQLQFQLSGITTGTVRTLTIPDLSGAIALTSGVQAISGKTLGRPTYLDGAETIAAAPSIWASMLGVPIGITTVLNFVSAYRPGTISDYGTTEFSQTAIGLVVSDGFAIASRSYKNTSAVALGLGLVRSFVDGSAMIADAAAVTGQLTSFRASASASILGGGTLVMANFGAFSAGITVGPGVTVTTMNVHGSTPANTGGVITTLAHYKANNVTPSGGGSIGTMYGLSIDALIGATTLNMGIRLAAGIQYEPTARTIAAVGDSLVATTAVLAARYELTNSSGGSLTLTSAPTLPDGVAGQTVTFLNVGAQNIVIQDQGTLASSNLRLSATTITLGPRDSIRLVWSVGIGDWVQESQTNVL